MRRWAFIGLTVLAAPGSAAIIQVNQAGDALNDGDGYCNIREAVAAANSNARVGGCDAGTAGLDIVLIEVPVIQLQQRLNISESLWITGSTVLAQPAVLDAQNLSTVLHVNQGGAAPIFALSDVHLMRGHTAIGSGGGLFIQRSGAVWLFDCAFSDHSAVDGGAVLVQHAETIEISRCQFTGNNAVGGAGGALHVQWALTGDGLLIEESVFKNNSAHLGGAVQLGQTLYDVTILGSLFQHNHADAEGGALRIINPQQHARPDLHLRGSAFIDNDSPQGGALNLRTFDAPLHMTNVTLSGNRATQGGAMLLINGGARLAFVTLHDNRATDVGDGLFVFSNGGHRVAIANSIISGATASQHCHATFGGGFDSLGHNVFDDGSCDFGATGDVLGGADLEALSVGGNGVPGHRPGAFSAAVDRVPASACRDTSGTALTHDQQNRQRPQDGDRDGTSECDAGALERPARRF